MHDRALEHNAHTYGEAGGCGIAGGIEYVSRSLPDFSKERVTVFLTALARAHSDNNSPNGREIRGFIELTPLHYGATRKAGWLKILRRHTSDSRKRIDLNLAGFPNCITFHQRRAIMTFMVQSMADELASLTKAETTPTPQVLATDILIERFGIGNRLNTPRPRYCKESIEFTRFA